MNKAELEELKLRIAKQMDVSQLLDILGFDMYDLVDILEDHINENSPEFEEVL